MRSAAVLWQKWQIFVTAIWSRSRRASEIRYAPLRYVSDSEKSCCNIYGHQRRREPWDPTLINSKNGQIFVTEI